MSSLNQNEPSAMGPREAALNNAARAEAASQQLQEPSKATGAGVNTGAGTTREKTEAELQADRDYEERMEEEYAKRDGGA
ncbi:hypothetical protein PG996_013183 [Apiospora saccharicola]|uniref:SMP domain-containing protein n=1 Tax=Apiospora saccharicola TaxID=335842 RepID=A0ABR1U4S9_9PEZI